MIRHVKTRHPGTSVIMAGHSAGGGTAIRTSIRPYARDIDAYLLFAPAISPRTPASRKRADKPATFHIGKIVWLTLANAVGIRRWNDGIVFTKQLPENRRHGTETLELSFRLLSSRVAGRNFTYNLRSMTQPTLILAGADDEEFVAEQYGPLFARHNRAEVRLLPGLDHDGIVASPETFRQVGDWMAGLSTGTT